MARVQSVVGGSGGTGLIRFVLLMLAAGSDAGAEAGIEMLLHTSCKMKVSRRNVVRRFEVDQPERGKTAD